MIQKYKKTLIILLLSISSVVYAAVSPPVLTPHDTYHKTEEILKVHAKYKTMNNELMQRTFRIFIDKIDPLKVYLLDSEVDKYKNSSDKLLSKAVTDYQNKQFPLFMELYDLFAKSIDRRNNLEKEIAGKSLPQSVDYKQIEKMGHPTSSEECRSKLLLIKGLQEESILLLDKEKQEKQRKYILKKRANLEKELITESALQRKRMVHAFFLKSVAEALDSHTTYFTPHEAKQFIVHIQQRLFGIGALLSDAFDGLVVEKILKGGPASRGKLLKKGDKIIAVNSTSVIGMDLSEAVDLIRGAKKTSVTLSIVRTVEGDKQTHSIEIIRDEIVVEKSRYTSGIEPFGDGVIAHLHLHSFYGDPKTTSMKDLKKEIQKIEKEHKIKGIILDLRNNGGGLLTEAINISSLFMNKGVVAAIRTHTGDVNRLRNLSDNKVWDGPLIILTNKVSASASEIVSLALSDYGRAIIVGDSATFGKGTYQTGSFFDTTPDRVNPKGVYKVTGGVYYTVGGKSPQLTGVISDIVVPGIYAKTEIGEKFTKYPLENDSIDPLFDDDLSDIHPLYRFKVKKLLKSNLQKRGDIKKYLPTLISSSKERIQNNKDYQNFLYALDNPKDPSYIEEHFTKEDLQLSECKNIMKEFILLQEKDAK